MESGAKGAEVTVSGKLRGQRAKSQKFADGYMIKTGHAYECVENNLYYNNKLIYLYFII